MKRIVFGGLILSVCFVVGLSLVTCWQFESFEDAKDGIDHIASQVLKPIVCDRNGQRLNFTYKNRWNLHDQLPLTDIPLFLRQSFVLAEDKRFYQHSGADWRARLSAAWQNLQALSMVRGASTISEQVTRMLRPRSRTLWSRWLEGWEAGSLEKHYSKADILEFYLNQVPYGAQRRGVGQASHYYFGRDTDTLSHKEMLALAVMVRSPSGLSPRSTFSNGSQSSQQQPIFSSLNRRLEKAVIALARRMHEAGFLAATDVANIAGSALLVVNEPDPPDVSHFIRYVQSRMQTRLQNTGINLASPVIHSSLDLQLQRKLQKLLDTRLDALQDRSVANGAVLVADHHSNEILTWVVGYADKKDWPFNQVNAPLVPRQPGSALKPFVYALALEQGWHAATLIDDLPLTSQVGSGLHQYHNYSRQHYGPVSLREALGNSLNIPALKAVDFVGVPAYLSLLHDLGIDSLIEHPSVYGDGIVLGNGEITLFELVQAYAVLARGGVFAGLQVLQSGTPPESGPVEEAMVVDPAVASLLADILSDPRAREKEFGRYSILNFPYQTAVKTGTSSDYRDAWALGFNDRYTVGVWMGNLDYRPMDEVTGSVGPAMVLRSVFHELNKNRVVQPLWLSKDLHRLRICQGGGQTEGTSCEMKDELFTDKQRRAVEGVTPSGITIEATAPEDVVRMKYPSQGLKLAKDPRIPDGQEYFEFEIAVGKGVTRVDWFVDQKMIASTSSERALWQVQRGTFKAYAQVWRSGESSPVTTESVSFVVH